MERLDKIIANRGIASRREVKELVRQGRVLVDGVPAAAPDMKISPETAAITVDGVPVCGERYLYLLLHKPAASPRCWIWCRSPGAAVVLRRWDGLTKIRRACCC